MRSRKVLTGVALAIAITIGHADTSSAITPTRSEINLLARRVEELSRKIDSLKRK